MVISTILWVHRQLPHFAVDRLLSEGMSSPLDNRDFLWDHRSKELQSTWTSGCQAALLARKPAEESLVEPPDFRDHRSIVTGPRAIVRTQLPPFSG